MKYLNVFTSKNNSPKKAQRTLILGSLAILFVLVSFFINTLKVKDTSKLMEHTQEVLRTNDNLLLDAMYLETGSRAFILTSARSYLQPYNASKNTIRINLKKLKHLTQDNSEQLPRLVIADRLITQLLYNSKYAINQKIVTNQTLAEKLVAINRIEETANKTRTIIAEINNAEFQLLNLRKSENKTSISNNNFLFIILLLFFLLIVLLGVKNLKAQKAKTIFAEKLSDTNAQLKKSVKEISDYKFALQDSYIVAMTDAKGIITDANQNFANISGYTINELIGSNHRILNSGFHPKDFFTEMYNAIARGEIWRGEIKNKAKNGSLYWVDSTIVPFMNEHNKPYQYVAIRIDITDKKNAQAKLEEVNNELEAFTYSVSHDLRAPLRAINGYAKIIQEDYETKLDADGMLLLNSIIKNSRKMGDLIDDLLAFSRLGRKPITASDINMKGLVHSVKEEELIGKTISINTLEILPASGQQALIKQVWVNLISNAIKYSQHKTNVQIEIGSYKQDNFIVYYVKDNGAGFDMQYYGKLFGVFQRLHSAEEFEGTGIGLAIVQKIISRHNGTVWAKSELDKGATFYFSLPSINNL